MTLEDMAAAGMFDPFPPQNGDSWSSNMEAPQPEHPWDADKLNAEVKARQDEEKEYTWDSPLLFDERPAANTWSGATQYDDHEHSAGSQGNNQYPTANTWKTHTCQVPSDLSSKSPRSSQSKFGVRSPYVEDYEEDTPSSDGDYQYDSFYGGNPNSYQQQGYGSSSFGTNNAGGSPKSFGFGHDLTEDDVEELDFENMFTDHFAGDRPKSSPKLKQTAGMQSIDKFISAYTAISREQSRMLVSKKHRAVTKSDIAKWKLPRSTTGTYWDPDEAPIVLLADAFDAFSLGRWIYDWTEVYKGPDSYVTETAEDLWSLLVNVTKKLKTAKAAEKLIKNEEDLETVQGFIESAVRLMARLQKVLKNTEKHMFDPVNLPCSHCSDKAGQKAGIAFVDAFFTDEDLAMRVESIMYGMDVWIFRYDVNCKETVDYFFR